MREHRRKVRRLMQRPLPPLSEQKQLVFRPSQQDASRAFNLLNNSIFNGKLKKPKIEICRMHGAWGECVGDFKDDDTPFVAKIRLNEGFYSIQWFITVLAHEMSHQYQWEVLSPPRMELGLDPIMSHGQTFFMHKDKMADMGIFLKSSYRSRKWFKTQDLFKC